MKFKKYIFIVVLATFANNLKAQNVLDGVYIREFEIQNGDTLETIISGKVIDNISKNPLADVVVEYFSSNGQSLFTKTDNKGDFIFKGLSAENITGTVICTNFRYKTIKWEFNTIGISNPRKFSFNFEMEKNK